MTKILESCRGLPTRDYAEGEVLLDEGEVSDRLLVLAHGEVVVTKGGTEVARVSEPGAIFGEISALLGTETTARVAARSPARAFLIEDAPDYITTHPKLLLHTARILARRLMDATSYLADIKRQYQGHTDHFGMVDQVLERLLQQQERWPDMDKKVKRRRTKDPRL